VKFVSNANAIRMVDIALGLITTSASPAATRWSATIATSAAASARRRMT
jgi:hypothetical protein